MITTITPKILVLLFRKLSSQRIYYDLSLLRNTGDRASGKSYCIGYRTNKPHCLVFRRTDNNNGWPLCATKQDIIFNPKENIGDPNEKYWNVRITPDIAKELLRQRREHK